MDHALAVRITPVTRADVDDVMAHVRAVLAEFGLSFGAGSPTDAQLAMLPDSYAEHGGGFWVARDPTGALLGTCGVFPVDVGDFELRKMYLSPSARGRGVGRALLGTAIEFARERGARRLVLDTTEQMDRAIAFYEAHGFVRDDTQKRAARCTRGYALDL